MKKENIFLVGGALRNKILKLVIKDYDWVIIETNKEILFDLKFKQVGNNFPVFLHPITKEEYALARLEKKIHKNEKIFKFNFSPRISLNNDLYRRDLSMNIILLNKNGKLINFYNNIKDLNLKIIRHNSSAFSEDPLRILRVFRFTVLFCKFNIHYKTSIFLLNMILFKNLRNFASERIYKEFVYIFSINRTYFFLKILNKYNAILHTFRLFCFYFKETCVTNHIWCIFNFKSFIISLYSSDPVIKFSVFCYYFFYYIFKDNRLKLYDKRKIIFIITLCNSLKIPNKYKSFSIPFVIFYSFYYKIFNLCNNHIVLIFTLINAIRNKILFIKLLFACDIDSYDCNDIKKYYLLDILNELSNLKIKIINKNKYDIKKKLTYMRWNIINKYKIEYSFYF